MFKLTGVEKSTRRAEARKGPAVGAVVILCAVVLVGKEPVGGTREFTRRAGQSRCPTNQ